MTRDEWIDEEFWTPETTEQAYNFGRRSAYFGHGRLSHAEFFRHDKWPRPFGTSGIYRAYRKGRDQGALERRQREEREAIEARARR